MVDEIKGYYTLKGNLIKLKLVIHKTLQYQPIIIILNQFQF